jgi:two-component system chemotaxis sensor kinase CheA
VTIDMTRFYQVFFDETEEHLAAMERLLLALDLSSPEDDDLNAIFRAAHSIKGSSGTFGFTDMADVTHELETLLDRLRKHEIAIDAGMIDAFLESRDVLKEQLEAHRSGRVATAGPAAEVTAKLKAVSEGARAPAIAPEVRSVSMRAVTIEIDRGAAEAAQLDRLFDELGEYGKVQSRQPESASSARGGTARLVLNTAANIGKLRELCDFVVSGAACRIEEMERAEQPGEAPSAKSAEEAYGFFVDLPATVQPAAQTAYGFFDDAPGTPAERGPQPAGRRASDDPSVALARAGRRSSDKVAVSAQAEASSIRVGVDKVDKLINLVGELVITQAMIVQSGRELDPVLHSKLLDGLLQLDRNTRDLQEAVMSIRMMPMSFAFSRYPRVVRDLAAKMGKKIELKTEGEATELDKGVIEKLADPLTHLVRNSVDHGFELPEARLAAGKPAHGTLKLSAFQQGGSVFVRVEDDGGGLNRERILAKARERGMSVSDTMSDSEVWELVFQPGFSTAETVTDVSGRGVGLDVVARNIKALGGRVDVESELGKGTRVTVRLPLTLAILDGLSVAVGSELYILPLACIVESLQPAVKDINTIAGLGRTVRVRGEYLPIVALHELFGLHTQCTSLDEVIIVIIEADGRKTALLVDALVGQQQVVIKSLESNYRKVPGVSGATILGDGRVALILDATALSQRGAVKSAQTSASDTANLAAAA